MEEHDPVQDGQEPTEKDDSLGMKVAGAIVAGCVFAMHWPGYWFLALLFGAIVGRLLLVPGKTGFLISLAYAAVCIFYNMAMYQYPYPLLIDINPLYYWFGVFLVVPVIVLWKRDRAEWAAVIVFAAIIPGIFTTRPDGLIPVLIMAAFSVLAFKSGALNRLCFVPLAIAAFHCYVFLGFYTFTGDLPQLKGEITSEELNKYHFPGTREPFTSLHDEIAKRLSDAGTDLGRGTIDKAISHEATGETFVIVVRTNESRIVVLDTATMQEKRSSFTRACGGKGTDFDLSDDARFIACTSGNDVNILDPQTLEWLDTINLNISRGQTRVRFGPPGVLYLSIMARGMVMQLTFDEHGHGLQAGKTASVKPGILPVAYIKNDHYVVAGDNYTGKVYLIDPDTMSPIVEKEIVPNIKMNQTYNSGDRILFTTSIDGEKTAIITSVIDLIGWEQPEGMKRIHGVSSLLIMPAKVLRSTR